MIRVRRTLLFSTLSVSLLALASTQTGAQTAAPVRLKNSQDITVAPDGSVTTLIHQEAQIVDSGLVDQLSQIPFTYDASEISDVQITEAYTQKPDGTKLPVDPATILNQQTPNQSELAPIYADRKQKVMIFPNVRAGDVLVYTVRTVSKDPYFPGQFSRAFVFTPSPLAIDDTRIALHLPKSQAVNVDVRNVEMTKTINGDMVDYTFHYAHPEPRSPVDAKAVVDLGVQDHAMVSTFKNQDDMAHAYAKLIADKLTVTPKIQSQADSITAGISDKREQARAIYEWVGHNVRYVAVELGTGALIPHAAEWTLNNGYGDCKDQAVLFSTLLTAKGIKAVPVLLHATNQYTLAPVPVVAQFNHVISYLPDFKLYADTTPGSVPFGELPENDYGRQVLHVVASGPAQFQTPVLPGGIITSSYKAIAKIEGDQLSVSATASATGPWAADLRKISATFQAVGTERIAEEVLKGKNMAQGKGNFLLSPSNGYADNFSISSSFQLPEVRSQIDLLPMITAMRVLNAPGDSLMGPIASSTLKDTDSTACYSGRQTEDVSLELPTGKKLVNLPADASIKTTNIDYVSHWSMDGQTLTLHREFITNIAQATCSGKTRAEVAAALARIRDDEEKPLMLAADGG